MNEQETMNTIQEYAFNIKIGKWVGFKEIPGRYYGCKDPHGKEAPIPPFTRSLDTCHQWIFPKLFKDGWDIKLWADDGYWFAQILKRVLKHKHYKIIDEWSSIVGTEIPALAVCRAVEFLIDNGAKK